MIQVVFCTFPFLSIPLQELGFSKVEKSLSLLGIETYIVIVLSPREEAFAKRPSGRALPRYQVEGD